MSNNIPKGCKNDKDNGHTRCHQIRHNPLQRPADIIRNTTEQGKSWTQDVTKAVPSSLTRLGTGTTNGKDDKVVAELPTLRSGVLTGNGSKRTLCYVV